MRAARWSLGRRTPGLVAVLCLTLAATGATPVRTTPPTGRIAGHVRDGRGSPVVDAQVQVIGTALSARTDTAGAYIIPAVPAGPATVRATRAGFAPSESAGTVRSAGTLTLNFTLSTGKPKTVADEVDQRAQVGPRTEAMKRANEAIRRDAAAFVGIGAATPAGVYTRPVEQFNTEAYSLVNENRFLAAASNPLVDLLHRRRCRLLQQRAAVPQPGQLPPDGRRPARGAGQLLPLPLCRAGAAPHPFAVSTEVGAVPVGGGPPSGAHRPSGAAGSRRDNLPPSNLVFLIDVSGSMIARQAAAGQAGVPRTRWASSGPRTGSRSWCMQVRPVSCFRLRAGPKRRTILEALDRLEAGGSTAGGAGIRLAYDVAREHFNPDGNNRVILATDGDFNVGVSTDAEMVRLIEQRRDRRERSSRCSASAPAI